VQELRLLGRIGGLRFHEPFEIADFAQVLRFRRHVAGVLQDAVGDAQVLGNVRIVVQLEGLAFARQVLELAALDGLGNLLFCD